MNQKELKELIEFLIEKDIAEFELERGDVKVRIKRGSEAAASAPRRTRAFLPCTRRRLRLRNSALRRRRLVRPLLRLRPWRRLRARRRTAHCAVADRGHLLRIALARIPAFREARRHGRSRTDSVHRGSHEVDERDRVRRGGRDREEAGREQWQPIEYGQELFAIRPRK